MVPRFSTQITYHISDMICWEPVALRSSESSSSAQGLVVGSARSRASRSSSSGRRAKAHPPGAALRPHPPEGLLDALQLPDQGAVQTQLVPGLANPALQAEAHDLILTRASTHAPTLGGVFLPRVLSLALRAADRGSRTHAAQLPPGVWQGASDAGSVAGA